MSNSLEHIDNETIDDLLHFVEGLRRQMRDVALLKAQYEDEDRALNYTMPWKRPINDRHATPSHATPIAMHIRYAPQMTVAEMEATYNALPEGWFHVCKAARMLNITRSEVRRRFFWMSRCKYIMYSRATQLFRQRIGDEKHNYSPTALSKGALPGNLPRTKKKGPRSVT